VTPPRTRFRLARLYITFRCNARCGYCNVWQDPVFFGHDELDPDGLRRCLDQVRELGVTHVDFTGGEPALHRHLSVAVAHAKQIGLGVELTTNAIRFAPRCDELVPHVDALNISLDTLSAERYHAIRGTDTLDRTVSLVERLRDERGKLKLITVLTRESLPGLDDVIAFAEQNRVPVYLSPMFEYFSEQSETRDPARTVRALRLVEVNRQPVDAEMIPPAVSSQARAASRELTDAIRARAYAPYTVTNLAFLRHLDTLDPTTSTDCGAGSRILTLGPDGRALLPCYHEWDASLAWDRPYRELIEDPQFVHVRDHEVGHRPGCRRCAVFPYLGLATSYRLTAGFLVQAVSEELNKIKSGLRALHGTVRIPEEDLSVDLDRLLRVLDGLPLRPGGHLDQLYHIEASPSGVTTDLAAQPVSPEEILADHVQEDCWRSVLTPHRMARLLYADVVPALVRRARADPERAGTLAVTTLRAHLWFWAAWLQRFVPSADPDADGDSSRRLAGWCVDAGAALTASGEQEATRSVAVLGLLFGVPADRLRAFGGVAGHREELHLAVLARRGLPDARLAELSSCFSPQIAAALRAPRGVTLSGDGRVDGAPMAAFDLAAAAEGDGRQVAALRAAAWRMCCAGDTTGIRDLMRRWKFAAMPATPARAEEMLLSAALGVVDAEVTG
jgi:MoaA/NifB/PqqE/SkfB family radical SAM enzyme